jgi:Fringe-like
MDDDVYLRSWHLRNFLSQFDPSNDIMLITAGGKRSSYRILGQAEYSRYPLYHCSRNFNFSYPWGQPVIYSRAARQVLLNGWMAGGLVHQCREFKVTHDVGNAIFHWIYSLPVVHIRLFTHTTGGGGQSFGTHGVNHETAATLNGKKELQSMYQVHDVFQSYEYQYQKLPIRWHNVTGFRTTKTYQTYGDPRHWGSTWHIVPYEDCWDGKKPPTTSARLKRMEILRQKCVNILDRLEGKKSSIDIQTPLKVFRIPCYEVFGKLQKPRRVTEHDVLTLENDLAAFPIDTPWLYFESQLS